MYSIRRSSAKNRVEIIFDGSHDYSSEIFTAELKDAALEVRSADGVFDLLVDFSNSHVLPQDAAHRSENNIVWCSAHGMRKSANIVPTMTHRMQLKRVSRGNERLEYFETRGEAESWLDA